MTEWHCRGTCGARVGVVMAAFAVVAFCLVGCSKGSKAGRADRTAGRRGVDSELGSTLPVYATPEAVFAASQDGAARGDQALRFGTDDSEVADIPIIMVSSVREDPTNLFPMAEGMPMITPDAYFTKPIDIAPFLDCVKRMLGQ